ncbi:hypothetical protein AB1484_26895 [Parafrankia sp. FMc6]|uniref:hypothetical protein n=1 Tax=Parafrankia soli TaxID=2599596 RepID=UPI0034D3D9B5
MGYRYRVTAPTQVTGRVLNVPFARGVAEIDIRTRRRALEYFQRRPEYTVEPAPAMPDPGDDPMPDPAPTTGEQAGAGVGPTIGDPPTGTVAEVLEWVHAGEDMAAVVARAVNALAVEQARDKARSTLVEELEALQSAEGGA